MATKSMTILLIESDQETVRLLCSMLACARRMEFDVIQVGQLSAGVARIAAGGVDLVLLGLVGAETERSTMVCQLHREAPDVPLVVIADDEDESIAVQMIRAGAQDYLVKGGLTAQGLVRAIRYSLTRTQRYQSQMAAKEIPSRAALDMIPGCAAVLEVTGAIVAVNRSWQLFPETAGLFGAHLEVGVNYLRHCDISTGNDDRDAHVVGLGIREVIGGLRESFVYEYARRNGGGKEWYRLRAYSYPGYPGGAVALIGEDITSAKLAEEALLLLSSNVDCANDAIIGLSCEGQILSWNSSAERLYGYKREALLGQSAGMLWTPDRPHELAVLLSRVAGGEQIEQYHSVHVREDGKHIRVALKLIPVKNAQGAPIAVSAIVRDVAEQRHLERQQRQHVFSDALTRLPNRAAFVERLEFRLRRLKQNKGHPFGVLSLDLDRFKFVNEGLGHAVGDQLLLIIAQRLEDCVRSDDLVARLGDDEFAVLLDDIKDSDDAAQVAERIQAKLMRPISLNGHEVFATASMGIVLSTNGYPQAEDMLRDADLALYRAKAQGRGRFEIFAAPTNIQRGALLRLAADLHRAVQRQEFCLHYQPIVSLTSGKIIAVEALIRWHHPERGMVPPGEFLPLAEETGLIGPIGEWSIRTACEQLKAWHNAALPPIRMSVNVSPTQFNYSDIKHLIAQVLDEMQIEPHYLQVELIESSVMENADSAIVILRDLQALGVQIAIDDFGTGYSSLSYLKRFPLSELKIDRSFIWDITASPNGEAIVTAMIAMAHNLKLSVVAEGVETIEQAAFLRSQHCDAVQGYFFSRPLPAPDLTQLLVEGRELSVSAVDALVRG